MKRITGESGYTIIACIVSFVLLIYILVIKKMICVCREKYSKKKVEPLTIYEA